jgi:hypothetical protein
MSYNLYKKKGNSNKIEEKLTGFQPRGMNPGPTAIEEKK